MTIQASRLGLPGQKHFWEGLVDAGAASGIDSLLSEARFARYANRYNGDRTLARRLYTWNLAAASVLLSYRCKLCDSRAVRNARYKIDVDGLLLSQDGKCSICKDELQLLGMNSYVVDHDHNCCPGIRPCGKCVRGLLCRKCNTGLGTFDDDPNKLGQAADYITNFLIKR